MYPEQAVALIGADVFGVDAFGELEFSLEGAVVDFHGEDAGNLALGVGGFGGLSLAGDDERAGFDMDVDAAAFNARQIDADFHAIIERIGVDVRCPRFDGAIA